MSGNDFIDMLVECWYSGELLNRDEDDLPEECINLLMFEELGFKNGEILRKSENKMLVRWETQYWGDLTPLYKEITRCFDELSYYHMLDKAVSVVIDVKSRDNYKHNEHESRTFIISKKVKVGNTSGFSKAKLDKVLSAINVDSKYALCVSDIHRDFVSNELGGDDVYNSYYLARPVYDTDSGTFPYREGFTNRSKSFVGGYTLVGDLDKDMNYLVSRYGNIFSVESATKSGGSGGVPAPYVIAKVIPFDVYFNNTDVQHYVDVLLNKYKCFLKADMQNNCFYLC